MCCHPRAGPQISHRIHWPGAYEKNPNHWLVKRDLFHQPLHITNLMSVKFNTQDTDVCWNVALCNFSYHYTKSSPCGPQWAAMHEKVPSPADFCSRMTIHLLWVAPMVHEGGHEGNRSPHSPWLRHLIHLSDFLWGTPLCLVQKFCDLQNTFSSKENYKTYCLKAAKHFCRA